jgi:hypothetical protein
MDDDDRRRRKKDEERRKKEQRERQRSHLMQVLRLRERSRRRTLHDKHRDRRKKDCMMGIPFILAFQGDPAREFYCNDQHGYELIHAHTMTIWGISRTENALERLERYMEKHVVWMGHKVYIYQAGIN